MDPKAHWDNVYRSKPATSVSWFQAEPALSLDLIKRVAPDEHTPIIDVGGGASTLVDGLLAAGYRDVTVLDLAGAALDVSRRRLGAAAGEVRWLEANALTAELPRAHYGVWHDRAVFHFLTDPSDRARYVEQAHHATRPGGYVIVASFATDGPEQCSGLDVMRYSADSMHAEFGDDFTLVGSTPEEHRTPSGTVQRFVYCLCRVEGDAKTTKP
jgi:SAM-dependent methyltransferase